MPSYFQFTCLTFYYVLAFSNFSLSSSLRQNLLSILDLDSNSDNQHNNLNDKLRAVPLKTPAIEQWVREEEETTEPLKFINLGIEDDITTRDTGQKMRIFRADDKIDNLPDTNQVINKQSYHLDPKMRVFRADNGIDNLADSHQVFGKQTYHIDPVLNSLRRKFRRSFTDVSSSSSREVTYWKPEYEKIWLKKKLEALNQSKPTGDQVNMAAERPWGVPCGDPNHADMPWGSCTLPMECDPDLRIYRGDVFCGRTRFVCCAIMLTTYDLYQGFDVSMDEHSMSTDSFEKRERQRTSKEARKRKERRDQKKREKVRADRKKRMTKSLKKIIREMKTLLLKQYRNRTKERRKRTQQLKKFIKDLKKQYRHDRKMVIGMREQVMMGIDLQLHNRLEQIKGMNKDFVNNGTFREIVVNGSITHNELKLLEKAHPHEQAVKRMLMMRMKKAMRNKHLPGHTPLLDPGGQSAFHHPGGQSLPGQSASHNPRGQSLPGQIPLGLSSPGQNAVDKNPPRLSPLDRSAPKLRLPNPTIQRRAGHSHRSYDLDFGYLYYY